jgi:ubiquinone/menaquinone biosynthesis C-methylase UbiE
MTTDTRARHSTVQDTAAYTELKRRLVGGLSGLVLEIGAGGGANFDLLDHTTDGVGLEPDRRRRRRLTAKVARSGRRGTVIDGVAEDMPLPDDSVDAVLSTIVLCSVRDQEQAVAEVLRVLRPGGRFVFFEHVAAEHGSWQYRWQTWTAPCSRMFDHGCDPSRETWQVLQQAPFIELDLSWFRVDGRPFIGGYGVA